MSRTPELLFEQPNVENTVPLSLYQSSSPERFGLEDENLVLHAGGKGYTLKVLQNDSLYDLQLDPAIAKADMSQISLFVLNSYFLIWFDSEDFGLKMPYQSIILHAIPTDQPNSLLLQTTANKYFNIVPKMTTDFILSIDLIMTKHEDKLQEPQPLFPSGSSSIQQVYESLSNCSNYHYDDDSEEEDATGELLFPHDFDRRAIQMPSLPMEDSELVIENDGNADDLDAVGILSDDGTSGMDIDVGYSSIAGTIRKRDDDGDEMTKSRRIV
ncbi:uncharacterized protein PRCAT00003747001 [Priceomyces carsonii]|uniref:uncharacterized protein n=1 Tax=Priceomyces carsonii TaxID=28549 RepID=UPI002EDB96A3|nr:unnamed protein product [Priceomyces carsonii]